MTTIVNPLSGKCVDVSIVPPSAKVGHKRKLHQRDDANPQPEKVQMAAAAAAPSAAAAASPASKEKKKAKEEKKLRVVSVRGGGKCDTYVARNVRGTRWKKSPFHNPFPLAKDATKAERAECLKKFEAYFRADESLIKRLPELYGDLGCWCAPNDCHARELIQLRREFFPNLPG